MDIKKEIETLEAELATIDRRATFLTRQIAQCNNELEQLRDRTNFVSGSRAMLELLEKENNEKKADAKDAAAAGEQTAPTEACSEPKNTASGDSAPV